jgi:GTP1/Obg family GTP-binding protein
VQATTIDCISLSTERTDKYRQELNKLQERSDANADNLEKELYKCRVIDNLLASFYIELICKQELLRQEIVELTKTLAGLKQTCNQTSPFTSSMSSAINALCKCSSLFFRQAVKGLLSIGS